MKRLTLGAGGPWSSRYVDSPVKTKECTCYCRMVTYPQYNHSKDRSHGPEELNVRIRTNERACKISAQQCIISIKIQKFEQVILWNIQKSVKRLILWFMTRGNWGKGLWYNIGPQNAPAGGSPTAFWKRKQIWQPPGNHHTQLNSTLNYFYTSVNFFFTSLVTTGNSMVCSFLLTIFNLKCLSEIITNLTIL